MAASSASSSSSPSPFGSPASPPAGDAPHRTLLLFGAGNIGLTFIAQIFRRSGYHVICADTDAAVLQRLRAYSGYTVHLLSPDGGTDSVRIDGIEVIDATDRQRLSAILLQRPLLATAVGARAFPHVLRAIRDLSHGVVPVTELDLVAAENIHDPVAVARETLGDETPRIHACSVGKMVPVQDSSGTDYIELRSEAYNTLICDGTNWAGRPPTDVPWIQLVDEIGAWMDRKLYIHNLGHAACAWRARAHDPALAMISDAIAVPAIRTHVQRVMEAAASVVRRAYPDEFTEVSLREHVADLITRFGNRRLGDTVERVGRDLPRKLGRDERLIGALRLAVKHDATDELHTLAAVARDAVGFGGSEVSGNADDIAVTERAAAIGTAKTVAALSPLDERDPVDRRILGILG